MFRPVHDGVAFRRLLSVLVILGMWSSAAARISCSHQNCSAHRGFAQELSLHSHGNVDSRTSEEGHCTNMQVANQMSDSDMPDMDVSIAELPDGVTPAPGTSDLRDGDTDSQMSADYGSVEASRESTEACCMMHSPFNASLASQEILLRGSFSPVGLADSRELLVLALAPLTCLVDPHDHDPPGAGNPRYVLNSTFRI